MRVGALCTQMRSYLKSWRNLSALGSPRLWAITAFTKNVQIEKAIYIKSQTCTSINTSVAQEKAKTRCLIKVILLDAKSGWRRRRQESFKIPDYL